MVVRLRGRRATRLHRRAGELRPLSHHRGLHTHPGPAALVRCALPAPAARPLRAGNLPSLAVPAENSRDGTDGRLSDIRASQRGAVVCTRPDPNREPPARYTLLT